MGAVLVILGVLVLLALVAVGVWLGRSMGVLDQLAAQSQIRFEEQLALWRIQSIRRQAQAEMRRIRDEHRPRSLNDR